MEGSLSPLHHLRLSELPSDSPCIYPLRIIMILRKSFPSKEAEHVQWLLMVRGEPEGAASTQAWERSQEMVPKVSLKQCLSLLWNIHDCLLWNSSETSNYTMLSWHRSLTESHACHSKEGEHSFFFFFFLKAETEQGHGALQCTVTQPGMSSKFWSLLPLLYSLQFVIQYLKFRRQRLSQIYLSFVISVSHNEDKRGWSPLHSPQWIEVRQSGHPSSLFSYLAISLKTSPSLPCFSNFRLIAHANI